MGCRFSDGHSLFSLIPLPLLFLLLLLLHVVSMVMQVGLTFSRKTKKSRVEDVLFELVFFVVSKPTIHGTKLRPQTDLRLLFSALFAPRSL